MEKMINMTTSNMAGFRRGGVPLKVAVHAPLDAIQSSGQCCADGDPGADDGTDRWQLGYQGIHRAGW